MRTLYSILACSSFLVGGAASLAEAQPSTKPAPAAKPTPPAPKPTQPASTAKMAPVTPAPAEASVTFVASDKKITWNPCPEFLPKGCGIAVLHGDPSKANVDIFFKVPGKSTIPMHTHTSAERMVLVSGELHVTYEGEKKTIMKVGTYAYGPAKKPHMAYCASSAPCVLSIAFEQPLDAIATETAPKTEPAPKKTEPAPKK